MTYLPDLDYFVQVGEGKFANQSKVQKFGAVTGIGSGAAADVWDGGGTWAAPKVGRIHQVTSTSTADDGTGSPLGANARTVVVQGLDASGDAQEETVTLNGTANVNTGTYSMIHRMYVASWGANLTNAGTITATATTEGTVTAQITIGNNQTLMAIYIIPTGKVGYLKSWYSSLATGTTPTTDLEMHLLVAADVNSGFLMKHHLSLNSTGTSYWNHEFFAVTSYAAGSVVKIHGHDAGAANTGVSAGFDIILIDA